MKNSHFPNPPSLCLHPPFHSPSQNLFLPPPQPLHLLSLLYLLPTICSLPPSSPPTPPLLPPPPYSVPLHEHKAEKSINPLRPPLLPFFLSFLHHPNHTPTPTHTHTPSLIPPSPPPPPPPSHAHNKTHLVRYHPPTMQHEEGKASERKREKEREIEMEYTCVSFFTLFLFIF